MIFLKTKLLFMRYSKLLPGLYTKSRHFGLSVITNALDALAPIVRMVIIILQMVSRFNGSISASGPHAAQVKQDDIARRAKRFQLAWPRRGELQTPTSSASISGGSARCSTTSPQLMDVDDVDRARCWDQELNRTMLFLGREVVLRTQMAVFWHKYSNSKHF